LKIGILLGDDIGKEVVPEAVKVMKSAARSCGLEIQWQELPVGKEGHERHGNTLPSVTEKALQGVRCGTGRRTQVNRRSSVESAQMTSKAGSDVAPRSVWTKPAYGPDGVRHRGGASLFQALTLNCGNLRRRWQAKGASSKGEADSSDAPSRDGAARSSDEAAVTAAERRGGVIQGEGEVNRASGRSLA